jgi:exodeoxyribonuclease VIII
MAHPIARALLTGKPGKAERSVYWIDEATGELCRCRPDFWREDDIVVDLKTTEDASPEGFGKSIANWSYDTQDAFYRDGCAAVGKPLRAFVFLAVEKSARVVEGQPLGVAVYQLDEAGRDLGRAKYRADLATYAQCKATNKWPCYSDKLETISLPQWHMNRNAHLVEGVA